MSTTAQPIGSFDPVSGEWVLVADWECATAAGRLILHHGFMSDGASIPRYFWAALGPRYSADTFASALVHDALYAGELCAREVADAVFYSLLIAAGLPRWRAALYWYGVRAGGAAAWKRHTPESIKAAREYASLKVETETCTHELDTRPWPPAWSASPA